MTQGLGRIFKAQITQREIHSRRPIRGSGFKVLLQQARRRLEIVPRERQTRFGSKMLGRHVSQ